MRPSKKKEKKKKEKRLIKIRAKKVLVRAVEQIRKTKVSKAVDLMSIEEAKTKKSRK